MPNYFKFVDRRTGEAIDLNTIDELICGGAWGGTGS